MNQDEASRILERHFSKIARAIVTGYGHYRRYPAKADHRSTTKANVVSDEIWAEAVREFDGVPGVRPLILRRNQLRFLAVEDRVLLWFKKVDRHRRPRNFPTKQAERMHAGENLSLFPDVEILVIGYLPDREEMRIARISISKPRKFHPDWFIDLIPPGEAVAFPMPALGSTDQDRGFRVVVKTSVQLHLLSDEA